MTKASRTAAYAFLCLALLLLSSTSYVSAKKNDSPTDNEEEGSQNAKLDVASPTSDSEGQKAPAFRIRSIKLFLPRTSPSSSIVPLYTFTSLQSSDSLADSAEETPPASTDGHTVFVAQNPQLSCEVEFAQTRPQQLSLLLSLIVQNDQRNDASSSSTALVAVRPRQIPFPQLPSSPSSLSSSLTVSLSSTKFFLPVNGVYSLELLAADRMTQHRVLLIRDLTLSFASRLKLSSVPVPPSSIQPSPPSPSMWSVASRNSSATTYNLLSLPILSQPSEEEDAPVRLVFPTDAAFLPKPLIFHSFQQPGRRPHWVMSIAASFVCTVMALAGLLSAWFLAGANFKLLWRLTADPTIPPYPTDSAPENPKAPPTEGDSAAEPGTAASPNLQRRTHDTFLDATTATWRERWFSQRIAVHLLFVLLLGSIVALLLTYFFVWNLFQTAYALIFLLPLVSVVGNQVLCDVRETRMSDKGWIEIANYKALDIEPLEENKAAARKKKH